ncbi:MAG: hypothetical protein ABWY25_04330 [Paenisporosarcina sp.]
MQINDEKVEIVLSMRHQFAKLVLGTVVGFGASKLTEKAYDAAIKAIRNKRAA